jgi:hypothetical protein
MRIAARRLVSWIEAGKVMCTYNSGRSNTRATVQANENTVTPENTRMVSFSPSVGEIGAPFSVGI